MDRQRLADEFEAALCEERGLSAEDRESILRQFGDALQTAPVELAPPNVDDLRASLAQTVEFLAKEQIVHPSERERLVRQFDQALEPLDSDEIKRTNEFARRIQQDGVEKANEWLAAQAEAVDEPAPAPIAQQLLATPAPRSKRRRSPLG